MRFFEKTKGAVSIFLVIILVPMMTVSALFVDASKVKLGEGVAQSAGDLALNTALTNYDTMLKDMYGLFATAQNMEELFTRLEDYYRTCITSSGVSEADANSYVDQIMLQLGMLESGSDTSDILNMELTDFRVKKREDASLANAAVMERQIVDFMKYRAPINTGLSFLSSLQSFTTLSKQTELVDKRQEYYKEQETVMRNAYEAWKYINNYNKSGFITSTTYFSEMKTNFLGYGDNYQKMAEKIIMDLYDAQGYGTFSPYIYEIVREEMEIDGETKTVPIFYTNSDKTAKKEAYTEYTTYSDSKKADATAVKKAITECYEAYNAVKKTKAELMEYNDGTYGQQYLIQTNRRSLYQNWVSAMVKYYEKYSAMRHAATYAGNQSGGASVMTTEERICGENTNHPYSWYYDKLSGDFDVVAALFNQELSNYNSKLQQYANGTNTDNSAVSGAIAILYSEICGYRTTVSDAKANLEGAVTYLGYVYDGIKAGGALEQKENNWRSLASSSDLKNTSMAKQDLAEIDSLSTYLNPTDVAKMTERLNNIIGHLDELLTQIDSYTFFGTKLVEISNYTTLVTLLENKIGAEQLKNVPTDKAQLESQVSAWCEGQFVAGQEVDVSWENQSGTQARLSGSGTDKLNFYSYLYTHFNMGSVSDSTTEKNEDTENGKSLYENIKSEASSNASKNAKSANAGNVSNINELITLAGRPSGQPSLNAGSDAETPAAEVKTDENAAKDTGASLGSMFSSLASAVTNMGADLRDKLYVSDYILSMLSYDTIEKEFAVENPGKTVELTSLTLTPINADYNFAYGKEVEYIIYGGTNASNLTKAYGSIYGIRLGFNLIYAFMDSEIRDSAFAIATPISAATLGVIPVPLIQAAIIIGIACCESAIDLNDIRGGESVPLFKTADSWHCSVRGLIKAVKQEASSIIQEGASHLVDEGTRKLGEVLDMTDEELDKYIASGTDELSGCVEEAYNTLIARHANTAIQKLTTLANNALEEYALNPATDMVNYVSDGLDDWLASEGAGVDTSSDIAYIVKAEAVSVIKAQYIEQILTTLKEAGSNVSAEIDSMGAALMAKIEEIRESIVDKIDNASGRVSQYKSEMIAKLKASMSEGAESVKNTLNQQLDGIFGSSGVQGSDNTGMASLLSFAYSDYLRLFLMIGLYTNEEGILLRTSDVVQANMSKKTADTGYRLAESAVYIELDATVLVKPTLLAIPLFTDVTEEPLAKQNWYTIQYHGIKGY